MADLATTSGKCTKLEKRQSEFLYGSSEELIKRKSSSSSSWVNDKFEEPILLQPFKSTKDGYVKNFKFQPRHPFQLLHHVSRSAGNVLYLHNTDTGECWGHRIDCDDVFLGSTETQLLFSRKTRGSLSVQSWNYTDHAKEFVQSPQDRNPYSELQVEEYWYNIDDINEPHLKNFRRPCDVPSYHGTIEVPLDMWQAAHMSLVSPHLFITTCSPTHTIVEMFDIATLNPLGTVKTFDGCLVPLLLNQKWGIFVETSKEHYKFQLWDRINNTWLDDEIPLIHDIHCGEGHEWKFCFHDSPGDVLVFATCRHLFLVEGFEKEAITGRKHLHDVLCYVDFDPARSQSRISCGCFADGQLAFALKHDYEDLDWSGMLTRCPIIGSVLTIDLRKVHGESDFFQILKLPIPSAPILSMEMNSNGIYLNTFSKFFDSNDQKNKFFCEMRVNQSLQCLGRNGINWAKCDHRNPQKTLAYTHPPSREDLSKNDKIWMSIFVTNIWFNSSTGIYLCKFDNSSASD